jgi:hypothetical protein
MPYLEAKIPKIIGRDNLTLEKLYGAYYELYDYTIAQRRGLDYLLGHLNSDNVSSLDYNQTAFTYKQDEYTKTLLNFNGIHTSTTITDEYGKTWTVNGDVQLNVIYKKFGSSSGSFIAAANWIDTPDHDDFTLGSGNFTFDFWVKRGNVGVTGYLFGQANNAIDFNTTSILALFLDSFPTNGLRVIICQGAVSYTATSSTVISDTTEWHHIAIVRYGNTMTIYIDGVASGTVDVTGVTVNNSGNKFAIGRTGEYASGDFAGYIDSFRFSKGIARWTANFMLPIYEYTK